MPTIQLTDQFGLDVDVKTDILSSLQKYAANLSKLSLTNLNLRSIADLTLANPSITSLHAGLNFDQPVNIGSGGVTLQLNAGVSGTMDIYVPPQGGGCLFDSDPYGDPISVDAAERYVSIAFCASAGPDITATINQLTFGFQPGVKVSIANYQKFEMQPEAPTILEAVQTTIADFCIPGGPDDLRALPTDAIITLEGVGTITFNAQANLFAAANPLATVSLPSPLPTLEVSAGGSVIVAACCSVTWDYQLRIRKLDAGLISLGFYRENGSETTVSVNPSAGISAGTSSTDLFSSIISAVSKSAAADSGAIQALGLPDDQLNAIAEAVKNAAQRKLEVSLLAALTTGESHGAAFLYEFDLAGLDTVGNAALAAALHGDLSRLTGDSLPAGVQMVRSIATDLQQTGMTWKVNLLGIYNYSSATELVREGTVAFEPVTGDLVITDKATAQQIAVSAVNFGADSDKLRHLLADSFLITAVYRGSKSLVSAPEIECSHSYFQLQASTSADAMRTDLTTATALGLLDAGAPETLLDGIEDFGRTMIYAETSYSADTTPALFLNGADAKPQAEFESAGREAIRLLVRPDAADAFRLRGVGDDQLWAQMRAAGQFNLTPLFPDLTQSQILTIASDYSVIVWWAEAMSACAKSVAAMHSLLAAGSDPSSAQFLALRANLAKTLADVTSNTKEEFGQPWGLVAMDRVSGCRASAKVQIAGARFAFARSSQDVLAAAARSSV
ncbi:MAG: hypothetical protein WCB12_13735 [Bryobacteraceae bacterium]